MIRSAYAHSCQGAKRLTQVLHTASLNTAGVPGRSIGVCLVAILFCHLAVTPALLDVGRTRAGPGRRRRWRCGLWVGISGRPNLAGEKVMGWRSYGLDNEEMYLYVQITVSRRVYHRKCYMRESSIRSHFALFTRDSQEGMIDVQQKCGRHVETFSPFQS